MIGTLLSLSWVTDVFQSIAEDDLLRFLMLNGVLFQMFYVIIMKHYVRGKISTVTKLILLDFELWGPRAMDFYLNSY